ncbi:hypothetical protein [Virgisporangium aliadipatigenens]|uniref:hypothetical protein n=1 Tax=Virgisporangium aliadipatigenens TaxID=741659 RepID=UPI0019443CA4|nr:hypothetical protein [Virgisporangium aliadipatigenens]
MLEARLFEAVGYAVENCPKLDKVMLIGGEPFIHEGMVRFLEKQRLDVMITVYTNFVWPNPDVVLPDNVYFLSSMDAPAQDIYGQLRRTKDFRYSQEIMRERSSKLLHIDTTVSKGNLLHMDAIFDITRTYPCTHWFLPIDPRMMRYEDRMKNGGTPTPTELSNTLRTAARTKSLMLDDDDLRVVEDFYRRRGAELTPEGFERTNDFDTFRGIYLSGVNKFKNETFDYRKDMAEQKITLPGTGQHRCAAIRRYMEISFTADGQFVPMVHCPELWDILATQRGPGLPSFKALMDWEYEARGRSGCQTFCGRTQFLGIDEYEDTFRHIAVEPA